MNGDFIVLNNDKEDIVEGREVPGDGIPVCNDFTVAKYFLSPEELVEWVKENTSLILENVIDQPVSRFSNQIQEIHPDYVINFNYTNTCEQYGINVQDICYIHGSVQDNNMVFFTFFSIVDNIIYKSLLIIIIFFRKQYVLRSVCDTAPQCDKARAASHYFNNRTTLM